MKRKLSRIQKGARAILRKTPLKLFPLNEGTKIPLKDSNGLTDASDDEEEVMGWLAYNPNFNIAAATGDGILVMDWDLYKPGVKEYRAALYEKYGTPPDTLSVLSFRGGEHDYYRYSKDLHISCSNSFDNGVDLKAEGGCIVLPPSQIGGVEYRWKGKPNFKIAEVPEWMYQFFGPRRDAGGRYIAKSTDEYSRLAQPVYEGGRHERMLIITGILLRTMRPQAPLAEALVHDFNARHCIPPLPTSEVEQIFEDIANKELTKLEKALSGGA